jgi:hypothetical protein
MTWESVGSDITQNIPHLLLLEKLEDPDPQTVKMRSLCA